MAVRAVSEPASVAMAAMMRWMRFMMGPSLGADGGGSGEELAQAHDCQAPGPGGRPVLGARPACPAGLVSATVTCSCAQQIVVAGFHELVVDVHGWAPSGGFCCPRRA